MKNDPQKPEQTAPDGDKKLVLPVSVPKNDEIGGPTGPEPTRYGDWERKGRVSDF
jgi:shikimate dehydrogenase